VLIRGDTFDVAIEDGVIAAVGAELPGGGEELDARGLAILPGVVDAHVHLNDPGRSDWEGFASGTAALAAGGATTCVDMPLNAHPPTVDAASFDAKAAALRGVARIDVALWGGIVPGNLEELDELAARGVVGFKAFMANSGIPDFAAADDLTLYEGMRRAATLGLPVAVHAESDAITSGLLARATGTTMRDWAASRPAVAETEAIARAIHLAEAAGCALHVVHVSTGAGVALVAEARGRSVDVSCETCPHYLVLDEEDAERLGAVAKCAPPLRAAAERDALWRAIDEGTLPMVASDHSPSPPAMKAGEPLHAWGGIAGAQSTLELLVRDVPTDVLGGFAARRLGLGGKGRLQPGTDADLVLVDLDDPHVLRAEDLRQRHPISPYVGRTLPARVRRTILRGHTVYADGRLTGEPIGRLVTP
jgi:allantoinase